MGVCAKLRKLSFLEANNRGGGAGDRVMNNFTFVGFSQTTNVPGQNDEAGVILIHVEQVTTFSATPSSNQICNPGRRCRRELHWYKEKVEELIDNQTGLQTQRNEWKRHPRLSVFGICH